MDYVVPYLRNHTNANRASFAACSKLLAALSEYQYTRKAWKKDGMELLLDPAFFQMDLESLQQWRSTVDNLMTHDKTTFKELMSKLFARSEVVQRFSHLPAFSQGVVDLAVGLAEPVL